MRLTLLALLAAPLPALAADMPPELNPAPPAGAPLEQRLYLASESLDALDLLVARITCVALQRAAIAARLEGGLLQRGWSNEADRLWRLSEALEAFEAAHIRPEVDAGTQAALLDAYVPGMAPNDPRGAGCGSFADPFMLRRVLG